MTGAEIDEVKVHRPRCCDRPTPEATWGMGEGTSFHDRAFITVWCTECGTDLVTLDPPSGGDRGIYIGHWAGG
jgi:hypothetical protein